MLRLSRRSFLAGAALVAAGCRARSAAALAVVHRPAATLPETRLPWLVLRDHFVATVGPHAGEGQPLGPLLVLADATFAPHSRFPEHGHQEMEILSVVIDGTLSHHGDQAHGATLGPRSAQLISARGGMMHAEGNDTNQPTHMLQLWFTPREHGGAAAYFARQLTGAGRQLVAGDDVMPLRADVRVWWIDLARGARERVVVETGRIGYFVALTGAVRFAAPDGGAALALAAGDGARADEGPLVLTGEGTAALWIDLPA